MKRLFVMSDSHGDSRMLELAAKRCEAGEFSHIIHLGDCASDAARLSERLARAIIKLAGNCDYFSREPREITLDIEGVKILMCHGDKQRVKFGREILSYYAAEKRAKLALYGHTHIQAIENLGGALCVNPGALMNGRVAIIEINSGDINPILTKVL